MSMAPKTSPRLEGPLWDALVAAANARARERRVPEVLRRQILLRDHHTCAYCHTWANEVDHRFPAARGGLTIASNLTACCGDCNRRKGARTFEEWQQAEAQKRAALAASLAPALRAAKPSTPLGRSVRKAPRRRVRRIAP
jgi:5-methylcytosine-specific restriction endonuclease McrA